MPLTLADVLAVVWIVALFAALLTFIGLSIRDGLRDRRRETWRRAQQELGRWLARDAYLFDESESTETAVRMIGEQIAKAGHPDTFEAARRWTDWRTAKRYPFAQVVDTTRPPRPPKPRERSI